MDTNWILSLREGIARCNAQVWIHDAPTLPKLRENDEHVMERALDYTQSKCTLQDINTCRMFLGIVTASDMVTPDGRRLDRAAYLCSKPVFRTSTLLWPCVNEPSEVQRRTWRSFLVRTWLKALPTTSSKAPRGDARRKDLQLKVPLGRWTSPPLTRQLFPIMLHGLDTYRLGPAGYIKNNSSHIVDPGDVPQDAYPFEAYDGCTTNDRKRRPPLNKRPFFPTLMRFHPAPSPVRPPTITSWEDLFFNAEEWERKFCRAIKPSVDIASV